MLISCHGTLYQTPPDITRPPLPYAYEYKNKKDLDDSMYELLHKIVTAADDRHCFSDDTTIQSLDEENRYWG